MNSWEWPDAQGNVAITVKQKKQLAFNPINALIDCSVSLLRSWTDTKKILKPLALALLPGCFIKVTNYTAVEFYK